MEDQQKKLNRRCPNFNHKAMAKSQPMFRASHWGRSIIDRENSSPVVSIRSFMAVENRLVAFTTEVSTAGAASVDSGSFAWAQERG